MSLNAYSSALSKKLLELYRGSPQVKNWYDRLKARRSLRTAQTYIETFELFLRVMDKKPGELVKLNPKQAYRLLEDWVDRRINSGVSGGAVSRQWHALASFFSFHDIELKKDNPVKRVDTYSDKIPTKDELKKILDAAGAPSTRLAIQFIAYAGMRPEDVCELNYGCVKSDLEGGVSPCAVYVDQQKTNSLYVTFIPGPTATYLGEYLAVRREGGENVVDSSPIILDHHNIHGPPKGIRRKTLTANISRAMRKSGIPLTSHFGRRIQRMRPYSLRKYFRSKLQGSVNSEILEAWMGHTNGLAQTYNGIKDLDPDTIEKMREQYGRVEDDLLAERVDTTRVAKLEAKHKEQDEQLTALREELKTKTKDLEELRDELVRQKAFEEYVRKKLSAKS